MARTIEDILSILAKNKHFVEGNKALIDKTNTLIKASKISPDSKTNIYAVIKLVGLKDDKLDKLYKELESTTKLVQEATTAKRKSVIKDMSKDWAAYLSAVDRYGNGSKQERKARATFYKQLKSYHSDLVFKRGYYATVAKHAKINRDFYGEREKYCREAAKSFAKMFQIPDMGIASFHATALRNHEYCYQIAGACGRLSKAYAGLLPVAQKREKELKNEADHVKAWMTKFERAAAKEAQKTLEDLWKQAQKVFS